MKPFDIQFNQPADPKELASLAARFGLQLSAPIKALYSRGNGGTAKRKKLRLRLLPLATVKKYPAAFFKSTFGYFPIAESDDSNPICVCCKPPLAGFVVQVCHDDSPRLLYRSLDEFYEAATHQLKHNRFFDANELRPAFDSTKRSRGDAVASHKMIALVEKKNMSRRGDGSDALRFACDLLSNKQVEQIVAILDAPGMGGMGFGGAIHSSGYSK